MNETMTKREQIAAKMMAALVARCGNASAGRLAWDATNYADALIVELKCSDGIKYELTPSQVEKMISDTIPGGDIADPQEIADAIREWFGYSSDDLEETPTSEESSAVEADKDGWIPHKPGDPMPCDGGSRIRIRLRNGSVVKTKCPEFLYWGEIPHDTDDEIIAWKPAE